MKNLLTATIALILLVGLGLTEARAQMCFDFDLYCDGLELNLNNGVITGYWRNTDCAGTDVPVSGMVMNGQVGYGGYVRCNSSTDPCPSGHDWGFFIDAPLDNTMDMYSNTGTGWTLWIDELAYTNTPGPCPFAPELRYPDVTASWMVLNEK